MRSLAVAVLVAALVAPSASAGVVRFTPVASGALLQPPTLKKNRVFLARSPTAALQIANVVPPQDRSRIVAPTLGGAATLGVVVFGQEFAALVVTRVERRARTLELAIALVPLVPPPPSCTSRGQCVLTDSAPVYGAYGAVSIDKSAIAGVKRLVVVRETVLAPGTPVPGRSIR